MTLLEKLRCLLTFGQGVTLPLPEIHPDQSPFELFDTWFADANKSGILLPESMSISTCSANCQPSSRMVLLKEWDESGFVFYTNYGSRKCDDMADNQKVALLFHWSVLQRQIRRIPCERNAQRLAAWPVSPPRTRIHRDFGVLARSGRPAR